MKISIDIEINTFMWTDQVYLLPTISYTYSKYLHGRYSLDLSWFKWGITIYFGKQL